MTPQRRALALEAEGRDAEAVTAWMDAFSAEPARVDHALHLALAMAKVDRRAEAAELLGLALAMHPRAVDLHTTRGNLLRALGRFDEALREQDLALGLAPDDAAVHANRCALFLSWGRFSEALVAADAALARAPDVVDLRFNRGTCLLHLGRLAEAEVELLRVLSAAPSHAPAHLNLGEVLLARGDTAGAEAAFLRATQCSPDNAEAHWNLALRLLARGEWATGWLEYEWRRRLTGFSTRQPDVPDWQGQRLDGALLVTAEQGLGDTFQFLRYLPLAQQRAGRVVFECPPALKHVLEGVRGVDVLVARGEPQPPVVAHLPLLSLPRLWEGAPSVDPVVLQRPAAQVEALRARMGAGLRVGIIWQGNPSYRADAQRSPALRWFEPLARIPGVQVIALQKQHGRDQLARWPEGLPLLDLGASLDEAGGPFVETAAALGAVDLLISSDTAVPHLAGALGHEVWLLLSHQADWRWGSAGETTPWYPRCTLFRQPRVGDWADVFARVERALRLRASV